MLVGLCNPWLTFRWKHQPLLHNSSRPSTTGTARIRKFRNLSFLLSLPEVSTPDFAEGLQGALHGDKGWNGDNPRAASGSTFNCSGKPWRLSSLQMLCDHFFGLLHVALQHMTV